MMRDYGFVSYASRDDFFDRSRAAWNPGKTQFWLDQGVDLVIDRREGYHLWDVDGRKLIDVHLNGGTYSLGHRHPELVAAMNEAMTHYDVGNHHFPSIARTALAERLLATCDGTMGKVVFAAGGGEAIDIALKTARHATQRRKIVSIRNAFHGHTGLAVNAGNPRFSRLFLVDEPSQFPQVDFNDLAAMESALRGGDVAAVLLETVPATYGFVMPEPGYLAGVKDLCERYGTVYIADEVQTGLMRTGEMWGIYKAGVSPDILVTSKGTAGGLYPLGAVIVADKVAGWLDEDGFGHISTFGGAELGCIVAMKVLEITGRPQTRATVASIAARLERGLADIRSDHPDFFVGIRQNGLVIGLEFDHPTGAQLVMRALYENGVWAIFSTLDTRVLQFKPGLLMSPELVDDLLERLHRAVGQARAAARATSGRAA
ncbi:class-III pyridoxal-phosphate-dependent aminotransferase [Embleya hyalina]|nr:aminotransferase class III-fold pyridoxal phosphate-dependent enzyme [Embleya hyalina]